MSMWDVACLQLQLRQLWHSGAGYSQCQKGANRCPYQNPDPRLDLDRANLKSSHLFLALVRMYYFAPVGAPRIAMRMSVSVCLFARLSQKPYI